MTLKLILFLALVVLFGNVLHYYYCVSRKTHFDNQGLVYETLFGTVTLSLYLIVLRVLSPGSSLTSRTEIFALFGLAILVVYLLTLTIGELKAMGGLVVPVALIFIVLASIYPVPVESVPGPSEGQLGASWFHILLIVTAYGAFSVSFLLAVGYLRAEHQLKKKSVGGFFFLLPSLEALDRGLQRTIWTGIILLTVGMGTAVAGGMYRGDISWTWFLDPNVLGAIITGLLYGTILFLHRRSLFTNRRIAFLTIIGFLLIGFLFLGMNIFPRMHRFL